MGNPVCLWQTELFKLNLKSSPSSSGYNRRRRLAPRSSGNQQAERTSVRAAPIVCPEESPLLAATHDNSVIRETITGGMTRRLRRELGLVILWASRRLSVPEGFQRASGKPFGAPAGAYLLPRGADAPTTARGGTCSSIGLLICTGRRSKGLQGASGKPTVSINVRQLCRKETDSGGLTRRLRREQWGFRPEGGSTFFRSERKYQRKHAARRLRRRPTSLRAVGFGLR